MKRNILKQNYLILNFISIVILIINYMVSKYTTLIIINKKDALINILKQFKEINENIYFISSYYMRDFMILFIVIAIGIKVFQEIIMVLIKKKRQYLNIILLIWEIIYFIYVNICCVPIMASDLSIINNILAYVDIIIFELINISMIILGILKINVCRKNIIKEQ